MPSEINEGPRLLTLAGVAARSTTRAEFVRQLQDFLRLLRECSTRSSIVQAISDPPPLLAERFIGGDLADAGLATHASLIARLARIEIPPWATSPRRGAESSMGDSITPHEITLGIRRGRPVLSDEHKRQTNAERQRRFRARRAAEWRLLRGVVERERPASPPPATASADITLDLRELP